MADPRLRTKWLLDAEDAVGTDADAQIAWLREQRKNYTAAIDAGDWATESTTSDAGSSISKRSIHDLENHDAIVAAIRYLGGTDLGSSGSVLTPQFSGILA
jgi:hypothetical protein